jgi:uncharacterized protein with NRDE domain
MSKIYYGNWDNKQEMCNDFGIKLDEVENADILLAHYDDEDYEGYAFVLFKKADKLYEVNGSHCSCYGLSKSSYNGDYNTQWEPEETSIEALRLRRCGDYKEILNTVLDKLVD